MKILESKILKSIDYPQFRVILIGMIIPLILTVLINTSEIDYYKFQSIKLALIICCLFGIVAGIALIKSVKSHYFAPLNLLLYFVYLGLARHNSELTFLPAYSLIAAFTAGVHSGLLLPSLQKKISGIKPIFSLYLIGILIGICFSIPNTAVVINAILLAVIFITLWLLEIPVISMTSFRRLPAAIIKFSQPQNNQNVLPFFITGFHFGILQIALFFIIQCYVTATFLGYFAVVIAWLMGVIINLKFGRTNDWTRTLVISLFSYIILALITAWLPPYRILLPVIIGLIICTALPAGSFFRNLAQRYSASTLFFHENNGFVLGFILSILGFVKWGLFFLYTAPLITFGITLLAFRKKSVLVLILLIVITVFSGLLGAWAVFWSLIITMIVALWTVYIQSRKADNELFKISPSGIRLSKTHRLVLFIAGFNLILLQYFITREFSIILAAAEITVLIVGAAYFTGFSVGYGISRFITLRGLKTMVVSMFFLHIVVLLFSRFTAGYLISAGYGIITIVVLLFLTAFGTSTLYSIFLPKLIEDRGAKSLVSYYTWDLGGAILGSIMMIVMTYFAANLLWPFYFLLLLILILVVFRTSRWRNSALIVGLFFIALIYNYGPRVQQLATEDYYFTRGYDNPVLYFSENSLYHTVDVIDTYRDSDRTKKFGRWSFLNGIVYFGYRYNKDGNFSRETGLSEFTYFLAELPAKYLYQHRQEKLRILILGCGSMYSLGRVSPYAAKTTMVEIDNSVLNSAKECWYELNQYDRWSNYELIVDDAKHYLMTSSEKFDLIIMDISAPYNLGTMLLHNQAFYQEISRHLIPGGIFAESTQGRPLPRYPNSQGMKILKGVVDIFPYYRVIDCTGRPRGKHGFIYASNDSEFETALLYDILIKDDQFENVDIYSENDSHFDLSKTKAYTMTNMETLLSGNLWRIEDQLQLDIRDTPDYKDVLAQIRADLKTLSFRLPATLMQKILEPFSLLMVGIVVLLAIAARYLPFSRK